MSLPQKFHVLIYIPLCFYFISLALHIAHVAYPYLHSTMLLLIKTGRCRTGKRIFIYIPLCFYFIRPPAQWHKSSLSHLHSTMLLLYRKRGCGADPVPEFTFHYASTLSHIKQRYFKRARLIYIPLCFYFISYSLNLSSPSAFIYIPLCFYFILFECLDESNPL